MFVLTFVAFALCFGLLILGPHLSGWIGDLTGLESLVSWVWWAAQWPILILGLLVVFATVLYLAPNVEHPRWQLITRARSWPSSSGSSRRGCSPST